MAHAAPLSNPPLAAYAIEVFFDGECPLCRREIALLQRWDRAGRIRFTDIAADNFSTTSLRMDLDALMAEIHGRLPDGSWIRGVEVFRQLYMAVGWGPLVTVSRWPGVRQLLEVGYRFFARNRLRWTGRCTSDCRVRSGK